MTEGRFTYDPGAFGRRIKELRLQRRWTQEHVSERSGLSIDAISAYELGKRAPSWTSVGILATTFDVAIEKLVDSLPERKGAPELPIGPDATELLDRALRVSRLREEAQGRRVDIVRRPATPSSPAHAEVLIADPGAGMTSSYLVMATSGDVGEGVIEAALALQHHHRQADAGIILNLVYGGAQASSNLVRAYRAQGLHLVSFVEHQGMLDLRGYSQRLAELITERRSEQELARRTVRTTTNGEPLEFERVEAMLQEAEGWVVLLFGADRQALSHMLEDLVQRAVTAGLPPLPVLIDLRETRARSLGAAVVQHLVGAGVDRVNLPAFWYMVAHRRALLLLDAAEEFRASTDATPTERMALALKSLPSGSSTVLTCVGLSDDARDQVVAACEEMHPRTLAVMLTVEPELAYDAGKRRRRPAK